MPKSNQYAANLRNIHTHTLDDITDYIMARIAKTRATMAVLIREDGRVRVMRDEMLEDDLSFGLVGHFAKHHDRTHIKSRVEVTIERLKNDPIYLKT